ncbi:hypothetical protein NBRC111894_2332 [Sporolactobacillus inulinus]|uniref:Uncharacterized protein n=1 Tax=Sporolactobacillus inulinus TaxID=2078 RepID=A0A4Y1ZDV6_9BACL|nr:hypothetical protein NBRC111894_2332 [Sporolactobacillus inulinus]
MVVATMVMLFIMMIITTITISTAIVVFSMMIVVAISK